MGAKLRSHLRSNVVAYLALFVALGGTSAYAANTVFSSDIVDGEVKNPDIGAAAVTTAKIGDGQVTSAKLGSSSVISSKLATDAVTNAKIATSAVRAPEIAPLSVGATELSTVKVKSIPSFTLGESSSSSRTANCDPGQKVIGGGGARTSGEVVLLMGSRPSSVSGIVTGWSATFYNPSNLGESSAPNMTVYAICLDPL